MLRLQREDFEEIWNQTLILQIIDNLKAWKLKEEVMLLRLPEARKKYVLLSQVWVGKTRSHCMRQIFLTYHQI